MMQSSVAEQMTQVGVAEQMVQRGAVAEQMTQVGIAEQIAIRRPRYLNRSDDAVQCS